MRKMMDDEKPFDLRDRLAIEILNGLLANSSKENSLAGEVITYLTYDDSSQKTVEAVEAKYTKKVEKVVRNCYKVADIVRRVRLSAFE
jgi:hypothetical protein